MCIKNYTNILTSGTIPSNKNFITFLQPKPLNSFADPVDHEAASFSVRYHKKAVKSRKSLKLFCF